MAESKSEASRFIDVNTSEEAASLFVVHAGFIVDASSISSTPAQTTVTPKVILPAQPISTVAASVLRTSVLTVISRTMKILRTWRLAIMHGPPTRVTSRSNI